MKVNGATYRLGQHMGDGVLSTPLMTPQLPRVNNENQEHTYPQFEAGRWIFTNEKT